MAVAAEAPPAGRRPSALIRLATAARRLIALPTRDPFAMAGLII